MVNHPQQGEMEVDDRTKKFVLKLREKYDWGPCRIEKYIRKVEPKGVRPKVTKNLDFSSCILLRTARNTAILKVRDRSLGFYLNQKTDAHGGFHHARTDGFCPSKVRWVRADAASRIQERDIHEVPL